MWLKYKASTHKEFLLLIRDKAGLAMLFIMPMALVLIMTLLQDSSFKALGEKKLPLLVLNHDADSFGTNVLKGLKSSTFFEVVEQLEGDTLTEARLLKEVEDGHFQIGIIIHEQATAVLRETVKLKIQQQFPDEEVLFELDSSMLQLPARVDIFFDPVTKTSFKQVVLSALRQYASMVEAQIMFGIYAELFDDLLGIQLSLSEGLGHIVEFNEQYATSMSSSIIPNSVQHNVPAWTIFAMFFIVIPLASNIIKERDSGLERRLKTLPGSYTAVLVGKTSIYFMVGLIQALFMLLIGCFILPLFGMPALQIGGGWYPLFILTIAISLAASGYGIVIGTLATSHEQSSIFGAISVVIMAALGGVWIPTFIMNDLMRSISRLSPLNWGLNGYYDVFLRNADTYDILPYVAALLGFFVLCLLISHTYLRFKRQE